MRRPGALLALAAVLANLYDSLTEFDRESRVVPALAAEWRNPDEKTWVFRLRPEVSFHDGRELSAEDVVFSLERARDHPETGMASYLVEVESIRATGPSTVEIRTLLPFPGCWRKVAGLLPLTFLYEADPARRIGRLLAGEADLAANLREDAVEVLRGAACCRDLAVPSSTVEYLRLSRDVPPFRDARVRQAIDLALDRPAFVANAHHGLGLPIGQLVAPGVFGFAPDLKATARDVPRARRLLAEAGFPDGFDVVLEHRPERGGDLIAAQITESGIRVTARESPWTELHPRMRRGEVGFYLGVVVAHTAEASDVLDGFVHTRDEVRGYGITNHSRYSNPKADALIEEAAASLEMTRRRELLKEAMRVVMADLYVIPIAGLYRVYGVREGFRFTPRLDTKLLGREISLE